MQVPKFGVNRFDSTSVAAFAADVARAEALGWDAAFQPDSQLRRRETYVLLAAAAAATSHISLSPFIANPVNRHPSVTASSIATVAELAPGRVLIAMGVGDTAVRLAGLRPAKVAELEAATRMIKDLLAGEEVDLGALRPAYLPHNSPVPVWIAAGGPRTLRMAGSVCDGVFIRAGTAAANIGASVDLIREGAASAGRDPASVKIAAVFHTVLHDDAEQAETMAKSMAAGYYEYTPSLFDAVGIEWNGISPDELKQQRIVWPDFHHDPDLLKSGTAVGFLPRAAADNFALWGSADQITEQLISVLRASPVDFEYVVLQPIPDPRWPEALVPSGFTARVATEVLPRVRAALQD